MFETVIRGGNVVDGTRSRAFRADVGISKERITAIGDLSAAETRQTIDAFGQVVAPGFVDVHNHSDGWMIREPLQAAKTMQGFTTEVVLLDGIGYAPVNEQTWREWFFYLRALDGLRLDEYEGWQSMEEFARRLDGRTTQNSMLHVPYANVRSLVCGFSSRPVDDFQMRSIRAEIRKGMEAGTVGLSTGLDYIVQCFASTQELIEACKVVAEFDGLYVPHIRYKLGMLPALDEALHIARESGARLHISHLKAGTGEAADAVLDWIEGARKDVSLSFDVYPYMPGSTMLSYLLPYEVWENGPLAALGQLQKKEVQERFRDGLRNYKLDLDSIRIAWVQSKENSVHQGRLLSEYVDYTGLPPEEALLNLLLEERLAVLCVYLEGDDRLIDPFLQHDLYMMGSDGIYADGGMIHPRQFGSAARLLGTCVREYGLMSIEDAVYKLSGHAAHRFGIKDRGVIREGAVADIVVFQPDEVQDQATYDNPQLTATGISNVLVGGTAVVRDAKPVPFEANAKFPGRFVRFEQPN
ncbi:MAG: amidohydrolase family protein [Fuerstiella sp.]